MFKSFFVSSAILILFTSEEFLLAQGDEFLPINSHQRMIKTDFDSVQVDWIRQFISGYTPNIGFVNDIAVDGFGNVCITGGSWGANQLPDVVTIKYNSSGDTLWVRRWNGPGNNWDDAQTLAIDSAGNVYVTGRTYSDSTFFDYVTIKYDSSGTQLWVARYDGPLKNDDQAAAIAVDGSGSVYVTGSSVENSEARPDYATIKYNSAGEQQWVTYYNGPASQADFAVGLALDPFGNVYVTGTSDDLSVNFYPAYATVKYNSDGVQQWAAQYKDLWSYTAALTVDSSGNAYVTGRSYALGTGYDYATIKYNTEGVEQWAARYNGPGTSDDYALAIALDPTGNVYVTGEAFFEVNHGSDYATIKYNASGIEQWAARYDGPGNSVDVPNAIALDAEGSVYITGESRNAAGNDDFATIKYNQSGAEQWVVRYDSGPGDTFDLGKTLAVDESRNVYVSGESAETGVRIITMIKYVQDFVSAQEENESEFREYALDQNYPNPFNPTTIIKWQSPVGSWQTLKVYDILGSKVATLVDEFKPAGRYEIQFDAANLASGVYIYQLITDNPSSSSGQGFMSSKKMLIIK